MTNQPPPPPLNPVICLMGPTAAGKSAIALHLVELLRAEIVSVDSAMIYRGMDIGTAKPSPDILQMIPHHLIDILDPHEPYSAANFVTDAQLAITNIHTRGKVPLLVGGTMMYFKALQNGLASLPTSDIVVRNQLRLEAKRKGLAEMHAQLALVDPEAAQRIHPNDPQRILRALEVYMATGKSLTELQTEGSHQATPHHYINLAIVPADREWLHQRIENRFDEMLTAGFIAEVEKLFHLPNLTEDCPSMRSVGYRQIWQYLEGMWSKRVMREKAIVATRQLAKRQCTWLRSWQNLRVLDGPEHECVRAAFEHIQRNIPDPKFTIKT